MGLDSLYSSQLGGSKGTLINQSINGACAISCCLCPTVDCCKVRLSKLLEDRLLVILLVLLLLLK